jgi:hypothetical protein
VAFDPEMVIGIDGQFRFAATGFENTLCKRDTGRNSGPFHFTDSYMFVFADKLFTFVCHNIKADEQQTKQYQYFHTLFHNTHSLASGIYLAKDKC